MKRLQDCNLRDPDQLSQTTLVASKRHIHAVIQHLFNKLELSYFALPLTSALLKAVRVCWNVRHE